MPPASALKLTGEPRPESRRAEICRTAARIFCERGFDATAVSDIAKALQMTKAGLYHYFASKEALLFEIMTFGLERLEDEVVAPARRLRDPEARLRQMLTAYVRVVTRAEGVVAQLFHERRALPPSMRKVVNDEERRYFHVVRDTLKELKKSGRLRDVDISIAALSIIGMIQWMPRWFRPNGRLGVEGAARAITDLAIASVIKPRRRRTAQKRR